MHILSPRSRVFQSLILGFLGLTFYAYYRTTGDKEFRPFILGMNISASPYVRVAYLQNTSLETTLTITSNKNTTIEPALISNFSVFHHSTNASASLSTFPGPQSSSSASTTVNLSSNNETTQQQQHNRKFTEPISIISNLIDDDSARAIYQAGHDVTASEKCPNFGKDKDLVIVIMSAPGHIEARTAIRQTWGHYGQRTDISVAFMLGTTSDLKLEKILQHEKKLYNDIIRGRFVDSYSNLTLKTISTLEWVDTYCPEAKFLLKTDDDMFINVPRLLSFIKKHENDKNVIFGRLARKWKPIRNKKSKYYVSQAQYKPPIFPDFTTGPAYLLSKDIINRLYEAALNQTYLKLEDVFTTGIVAHKLGIKRVHANEFLNKRISYSPCNVQRGISIHMVKYGEQFDLWKKLLDGKSKCN